jgi:hypothetical protein
MHREAVYGPYPHRRGWRVELHVASGGRREKTRRTFATESEALEFKRAIEREIAQTQQAEALRAKAGELRRLAEQYALKADRRDGQALTVAAAMERYKQYMEHEKGNKPLTIATTMHRLRGPLGDCDVPLHSVFEHVSTTRPRSIRYFVAGPARQGGGGHAPERAWPGQDVHGVVSRAGPQGWTRGNPFASVKGIGKRSRGKEQLRIEETRRVVAVALAQARKPASGRRRDAQHRESSLAVLVALYLACERARW